MMDILETSIGDPLLEMTARADHTSILSASFDDQIIPFGHGSVLGKTAVIRVRFNVPILKLNPTARLSVSMEAQSTHSRMA